MLKRILLILLIIFIILQFIRPSRNLSNVVSANDITTHYTVPVNVQEILKVSCNDCHSNNTRYPWYTNIQPVGWWLQHHVNEGKRELNFSEFGAYKLKKQSHKLEEVVELVKEDKMPLDSYLWVHKDAKLSTEQKAILVSWAEQLREQIKANSLSEDTTKSKKL